jgi:hypothetical protein
MGHLFLSCLSLISLFIILAGFQGPEKAYVLLAGLPIACEGVAWFCEKRFGFDTVAHSLWHLSFDASYLLLMLGIVLILRAFLAKQRKVILVGATVFAGVPIRSAPSVCC